jgi:hypothetical protein
MFVFFSSGKIKMTYQCDYCTLKPFAIKGWFVRHVREKHPQLEPLQKEELLFICDSCKASFKTNTALNRHKQKKHDSAKVSIVTEQPQLMYMMTRSKFQELNCTMNKLVESTEANLQELKKVKMELQNSRLVSVSR